MKQYIPVNYIFKLHPGFAESDNDEELHFISSSQLAGLYGLNWHECAIQFSPNDTEGWVGDTLHLHPLGVSDYKQHLAKMIHEKECGNE